MTRTSYIDLAGWTPRDAPRADDAGEIIDCALGGFAGAQADLEGEMEPGRSGTTSPGAER